MSWVVPSKPIEPHSSQVKSHFYPFLTYHAYVYWVNCNDLTVLPHWKQWLVRWIIPSWWPYFRLVNYFNFPRFIIYHYIMLMYTYHYISPGAEMSCLFSNSGPCRTGASHLRQMKRQKTALVTLAEAEKLLISATPDPISDFMVISWWFYGDLYWFFGDRIWDLPFW